MPSKLLLRNFESGHTYHLRHTAKSGSLLFPAQADYQAFLLTLSYYLRFPDGAPLSWVPRLSPKALATKQGSSQHQGHLPVSLHAFLLLPDHFHLLFTENLGGPKPGISALMRRLSVGYAMTYRQKHGGSGTIYHGKYKMVELPPSSQSSLPHYLHTHPNINDTFLKDPLHSSLSDYQSSPRPWLKPLPLSLNPDPSLSSFTLEK
ncbi:MAG: hypothetical protein ABII80_02015 [bacterium]